LILECSHVNYEFSISSSNFPTYDYYRLYKNDKSFIEHNLKDYNISFESFKNRALAVNIFYPQLKYTVITELQKTSIFDLLSTIGGELGLFLGNYF
jgi:dihydroorotate dehydrogenase